MTKGTFGEHLRREREMRGVSLQEISAATRISTRFLEALENEQWERLPGGVFNRGFVRAVAHFLGLDEEALVAEYAMTTDDKPEVAIWADKEPPARRPPTAIWVVPVLVAILGGAGWFAYWQAMPLIRAWRAPEPTAPSPAPPVAPRAAPPSDVNTSAAPVSPPTTPESAPKETLELKVDAGKETRLTVIADGKTLFDRKINAGEQQRFQAKERFEIAAANSTAILVELNGQTVPPLGPPNQPGRTTLTHEELKKLRGGQN